MDTPKETCLIKTLNSGSNLKQSFLFMINTPDGKVTLILSAMFASYSIVLFFQNLFGYSKCYWGTLLGLFLMPVLLTITFFRHRLGTSLSDKTPIIPCIVSNVIFSCLPFYFIWK